MILFGNNSVRLTCRRIPSHFILQWCGGTHTDLELYKYVQVYGGSYNAPCCDKGSYSGSLIYRISTYHKPGKEFTLLRKLRFYRLYKSFRKSLFAVLDSDSLVTESKRQKDKLLCRYSGIIVCSRIYQHGYTAQEPNACVYSLIITPQLKKARTRSFCLYNVQA